MGCIRAHFNEDWRLDPMFHNTRRRIPLSAALGMALVTFRVQNDVISEPRVAVGGIEPQPRRIAQAELALAGNPPSRQAFEAAAEAVAAAVDPLEDAMTNADYRRDLARTVTRRALERAVA